MLVIDVEKTDSAIFQKLLNGDFNLVEVVGGMAFMKPRGVLISDDEIKGAPSGTRKILKTMISNWGSSSNYFTTTERFWVKNFGFRCCT